jgi:hypothetical protein
VENIVRALAIQCKATKAKLRENPWSFRIAPWHFAPKFREHNESSGSWSIVKHSKEQLFKDADGKDWKGHPPPMCGPKQFIQQEIDGPRRPPGQDKWTLEARGISFILPSWMQEMAKKESKMAEEATYSHQRQPGDRALEGAIFEGGRQKGNAQGEA